MTGADTVGRRVIIAVLLLAVGRLALLPLYPLMDTAEARYADVARQMAERGDWVTPWFSDGRPFWGKPPLAFWLSAASVEVFGVNEFAMRLPHWALGVALAALVGWQGRQVSRRTAWHAASVLAGSTLFVVATGAVLTDMALAFGNALVMIGFLRAVSAAAGSAEARRGRWLMAAGACIGLLAKGPVALVLCVVPIVAWCVFTGRGGGAWRCVPWLRGTTLVTIVVAPWYLWAELRTPGFLAYFFVGEHWQRFITPGWRGDLFGNAHAYPRGTIWLFAAGAFLPWTALVPLAWLAGRRASAAPVDHGHDGATAYWLLWALVPLLFFTFAGNVIWTYVLPGLAPAALAVGTWTARLPRPRRVDSALAACLLCWSLAMAAAAPLLHASGYFARRSTAWLIEAVQRQPAAAASPLIFVAGKLPFSASFYSRGHARHVNDIGALAPGLVCPTAFVALPTEIDPARVAEPNRRVQRLGASRRHTLLRINCNGPVPGPLGAATTP